MPNTDQNNSGSSLRRRIGAAARLTGQQRTSSRRTSPRETSRKDERAQMSGKARVKKRRNGTSKKKPEAKDAASNAGRQKYAKRSARDEGVAPAKGKAEKGFGAHPLERFGRKSRIALVAACIVVLVCVILYPVGKSYYHSVRDGQRLQAQIDAVNERNETIEAETEALNTDEGIEAQARNDYNYVKEGENAVVVTNAQSSDRSTDLPAQINEDDIHAPQTWYYSVLDVVFFYSE